MIPALFDKVVVSRNRGGGDRRVHVEGNPGEPLCLGHTVHGSWTDKPSSVWPDGYIDDCTYCVDIIHGELEPKVDVEVPEVDAAKV